MRFYPATYTTSFNVYFSSMFAISALRATRPVPVHRRVKTCGIDVWLRALLTTALNGDRLNRWALGIQEDCVRNSRGLFQDRILIFLTGIARRLDGSSREMLVRTHTS